MLSIVYSVSRVMSTHVARHVDRRETSHIFVGQKFFEHVAHSIAHPFTVTNQHQS